MMLTTRGRYAVTAMADVAFNSTHKPAKLKDVAKRQGITLAYLEQIFARLRVAGLVKSIRGPGGGYVLTRDIANISIAEIVNAAEEEIKITKCSIKEVGCVKPSTKCLTHDLWAGLDKKITSYLEQKNLGDIVS